VECKNKCDTSNNMGNWKHLNIVQKISEQHYRKARHQGTTETAILVTAYMLYFGKYKCKSTNRFSWEITLHIP